MWTDPAVSKMTRDERLLFVGLITLADDEGRLNAMPSQLAGSVFPNDADVTIKKVRVWRDAIVEKAPNVQMYTSDGVDYISLAKWDEYNRPTHMTKSKLPAPSRKSS